MNITTLQEDELFIIPIQVLQGSVDSLRSASSSAINKDVTSFTVVASEATIGGLSVTDDRIFALFPALRLLVVLGIRDGSYHAFALPSTATQYSSVAVLPAPRLGDYFVFLGQPYPAGIQRFVLHLDSGFEPCCLSCAGTFSIGSD